MLSDLNFLVFLVIAGFGWLGMSAVVLLFPACARVANQFTVLAIGEILIILWLVIWGVRNPPGEDQPSESGS